MSATPKFAIFRAEKIKDFSAMARRVRHCERSGKELPANVDKLRQHKNTRLFPKEFGPENAMTRWRARHGQRRIRRNAVLAVELFLGMSPNAGAGMTEAKIKEWIADSLAWAEQNFGGKANVIAGATNLDEMTPHVHNPPAKAKALGR